jgi:hypothetical protein
MSPDKRIKTALDECRMLMLGAQILLGFQLQAPFQDRFAKLPIGHQWLEVTVLYLMTAIVALLILPCARHRIVEKGNASRRLETFITRISFLALILLSAALGIDILVPLAQIQGRTIGLIAGLLIGLCALATWCGPALWSRTARPPRSSTEEGKMTPLSAKIEFVLTEARVVLPGAQALMGFQLVIVLTRAFSELPPVVQTVHGLSLATVAIATILLIAPATFHRIVFGGEDDQRFHRLAGGLVLAATAFLALGLSLDIYVVIHRILDSQPFAIASASLAALVLFGCWHAWPMMQARWFARAGCGIRRN